MYLLFASWGWAPGQYLGLPAGERALVRAFLLRYLREMRSGQPS